MNEKRNQIWFAGMLIIVAALAVGVLELAYPPLMLYRGWTIYTPENSGVPSYNIEALTTDGQGRVWIGNAGGVSIFNPSGEWTNYTPDNSELLVTSRVFALAADKQDQVWIGTDSSLSVLHPDGQWTTYTCANSDLSFDSVYALAVDTRGRVWIVGRGCNDTGAALYVGSPDGGWETYNKAISGLTSYDLALTSDEQGRMWIGTWDGLRVFAPDGTWTTYAVYNSGLANDRVNALAIDGEGQVLVGTYGGGLSLFDPDEGSWKTYTRANSGLADDYVYALAIDREGQVWVGTSQGLSVLNPDGTWITYTPGNSPLLSSNITELVIDNQGRVWVHVGVDRSGMSIFDGRTALPGKRLNQLMTVKTAIDWNAITLLGLLLIWSAARITKGFAPWAIWFVVTTVSYTGLWISGLILVVAMIIHNYDIQYILGWIGYILLALVGGTLFGLGQWSVLRRRIERARSWILASIVTWFVSGFTLFLSEDGSVVRHLVIGVIIGGLAGLPQWIVLTYSIRKAGWWIPASASGWALFTVISLAYTGGRDIDVIATGAVIVAIATGAAIMASVTGAVLVWLLAQGTKDAVTSPGSERTPDADARNVEATPAPDQPPAQARLRRSPRWAAQALTWSVLFALPWLYAGWRMLVPRGIPNFTISRNQPVSDFKDKSPTWSPDGQQIAFVSNREGGDEVYVMNADGSGLTKLTQSGASILQRAIWSPDGRKIAFYNAVDFYVVDVEQALQGTNVSGITRFTPEQGPCYSAWSPDSQHILISNCDYSEGEIFVVNPDGSGWQNLSNTPGVSEGGPTWSPDGQQIAFRSSRDGNAEIYVINPDGSGLKNLTQNPAGDFAPVWSPDSRQIAFVSSHEGSDEIYLMNADGNEVRKLTGNSGLAPNFALLAWSPDGQHIAFVSYHIETAEQVFELYVIQADGSNLKKLADLIDTPLGPADLAWSPDSRRIAFASDGRIFVIDADGNNLRNLSNTEP